MTLVTQWEYMMWSHEILEIAVQELLHESQISRHLTQLLCIYILNTMEEGENIDRLAHNPMTQS